ncbi:MAG: hypothetical protein LQ343_002202 [Gyalolechia ehrenbergii]|nr:MAG: hypothetical protein LQ343_002202 [Gyalolechia ehrenbergii]
MESSTSSTSPRATSPAPPSLESLVSHLVASKRSLSSVEQVWRANEIVEATKSHLEASVITSARTSFLRSGIATQLRTLKLVHAHNRAGELEGAQGYGEVVKTLDAADRRLKDTMTRLKTTMVENDLRPEPDQDKSLLDFVDEGSVEKVLLTLQDSIGVAQTALQELAETNLAFYDDLNRVERLIESPELRQNQSLADGLPQGSDLPVASMSPIPDILQDMEGRSRDVADNLESLVKHFDLCLMAIKHTEGGGDAAIRLTADLPDGPAMEEDVAGAPEPIGDRERQDMLEVIAKDADQVEEVVMEIGDHVTAMESQLETVAAYVARLKEEGCSVTAAFNVLEDIGRRLQAFVAQGQVFVMRWDDEKMKINERMDELSNLENFYVRYLGAYDNLLVEIGRRQFMEQQMEKVLQDAARKLDVLYEEDRTRREAFRNDYGDYLPVDIWPGLTNPPLQFETRPKDGLERAPDISKSVIQRAIRRVERGT